MKYLGRIKYKRPIALLILLATSLIGCSTNQPYFSTSISQLITGDIEESKIAEYVISGGDPNKIQKSTGGRLIHTAVLNNNYELVSALITHGADINAADPFGRTPLHIASMQDNAKIAELLIKADAGLSILDKNFQSPAEITVIHNATATLRNILLAGYDINSFSKNRLTLLQLAISKNSNEVVKLLLSNGADPNLYQGTEKTPLIEASIQDNYTNVELLLKSGADPFISVGGSIAVIETDDNKTALLLLGHMFEVASEELDSNAESLLDFVSKSKKTTSIIESGTQLEAYLPQIFVNSPKTKERLVALNKRYKKIIKDHLKKDINAVNDAAKIKDLELSLTKNSSYFREEDFDQILTQLNSSFTILSIGNIDPDVLVQGSVKTISPLKKDFIRGRFTLIFTPTTTETKRTIENKITVQSSFKSGQRTVPNPTYQVAWSNQQNALIDYQRALNEYNQISSSSNSSGNIYIGILRSTLIADASTKLSQALTALQHATSLLGQSPQYIQRPILSDYSFVKADIAAEKIRKIGSIIIDTDRGHYTTNVYTQKDIKRFELASGLKAGDNRRFSAESDIEKWEKATRSCTKEGCSDSGKLYINLDKLFQAHAKEKKHVLNDFSYNNLVSISNKEFPSQSNLINKNKNKKGVTPRSMVEKDSRFDSVIVIETLDGNIGTGFFIDENLVLTNQHVIDGESTVSLIDYDGNRATGKVVRADLSRDLALIHTETRGKPVKLKKSGPMRLGATVDAIGHPSGLTFTITRGIISSVRKMPQEFGSKVTFIQTDVPINPGNSGGPLFQDGEVIGMNTWKFSSISEEGLGFAVHFSEISEFLNP